MWLLDSKVRVLYKKQRNCLPKWPNNFAFSPAMNESSCYSTSSSPFGVVNVLDFRHSNRFAVVPPCLNSQLNLQCNVEYLFICLFTICMSSLVGCLLRSFDYCLSGVCFLIGFLRVPHIFWIQAFIRGVLAKYFLPVHMFLLIYGLYFYSLNGIFGVEVLIWKIDWLMDGFLEGVLEFEKCWSSCGWWGEWREERKGILKECCCDLHTPFRILEEANKELTLVGTNFVLLDSTSWAPELHGYSSSVLCDPGYCGY